MDVRLDGEVHVSLSERNLADLTKQAQQLDNPWLVGEAEGGTVAQLVRNCSTVGGVLHLRVTVERDAVHYGDRTPGPGVHGDDI